MPGRNERVTFICVMWMGPCRVPAQRELGGRGRREERPGGCADGVSEAPRLSASLVGSRDGCRFLKEAPLFAFWALISTLGGKSMKRTQDAQSERLSSQPLPLWLCPTPRHSHRHNPPCVAVASGWLLRPQASRLGLRERRSGIFLIPVLEASRKLSRESWKPAQ